MSAWRLPLPFYNAVTELPCFEPPYAQIGAMDLNTGKMLWKRPIGSMKEVGPFGLPTGLPFLVGTPVQAGVMTVMAVAHTAKFDIRRQIGRHDVAKPAQQATFLARRAAAYLLGFQQGQRTQAPLLQAASHGETGKATADTARQAVGKRTTGTATGDFLLKQIKNLSSGGTPTVISQFDYTYRPDRSIVAEHHIADHAGLLVDVDVPAQLRLNAAIGSDHGVGTIVCRPPGDSCCWREAAPLVLRLMKSLT